MRILFILNDSPYGIERTYNGLRLAMSVSKKPDVDVSVNLVGDAVQSARKGQKTPDGYYNIERMIQSLARKGVVDTWGSCSDARGLGQEDLIEGVKRSTMEELAARVVEADKVLIF